MSRIVALLGAECTGKSTLAEALSRHFGGGLVTEYLREWCDTHGRTPLQHEQAHIAAEQARRIEAAARARALVICDTTPLITALCSQHYFHDDSLLAEALALQHRYDLTLLCEPDLPWQPDGFQRDGPQVRAAFHARLLGCLHQQGLPVVTVSGNEAQRFEAARSAVTRLPRLGA